MTSSTGALVQSLAFDAWGLRRNASTWAPLASPFGGTQPTKRGYTGHEHLDNVELVHMNGRVQDPRIGLFISADPFVQAPYRSQAHNRYAYAWNNPTSLLDPSGFMTEIIITAPRVIQPYRDERDLTDWYIRQMMQATGADYASDPSFAVLTDSVIASDTPVDDEVTITARCPPGAGGACGGELESDNLLACGPCLVIVPVAGYLMWKLGQDIAAASGNGSNTTPGTSPVSSLDATGSPNPDQDGDDRNNGGDDKIPWSSKSVRDAARDLERGKLEVTVANKAEAAELFLGRYQGYGYRNTTGMSPRETVDMYGGKAGTYHWDIGPNPAPHVQSHLQIHTFEGSIIRIFFP